MSESNSNVSQKPPEEIRNTVLNLAEKYLPKLPEVVKQIAKDSNPQVGMAIRMVIPFLPKLSDSLLEMIDSASDEKIIEFTKMVNEVAAWLNSSESESSAANVLH